jgi:hypothetical protein
MKKNDGNQRVARMRSCACFAHAAPARITALRTLLRRRAAGDIASYRSVRAAGRRRRGIVEEEGVASRRAWFLSTCLHLPSAATAAAGGGAEEGGQGCCGDCGKTWHGSACCRHHYTPTLRFCQNAPRWTSVPRHARREAGGGWRNLSWLTGCDIVAGSVAVNKKRAAWRTFCSGIERPRRRDACGVLPAYNVLASCRRAWQP